MTTTTWAPPASFAADLADRYGLTCPPRWGMPRNPGRPSLGPKLCRVMERLGQPAMPWQRYVADVALEIDPATDAFAYGEVDLSISRQQGKTTIILGAQSHRGLAWRRQNIVYAAQTRGMARQRFEDEFIPMLEASALGGKFRTRMSNGNEAIIWSRTRSTMKITSNTEKAGHGPPLDMGVIDEAFAHEDDRLEQAMSPAMLTKPMAQLWMASAGGTERSVFLNKKREAGRAMVERFFDTGEAPAVAYFEWFAPDELPRDDPDTWLACLPALCPDGPPCRCDPDGVWHHTVFEAKVRAELSKMDAAEFDRAYMNRTRKKAPPEDPNIPKGKWPGMTDSASQAGDDVVFVVDVSQDRRWTSIGLASVRPDGRTHLEVVDRRAGTAWVVPALTRLAKLWDPLLVAVARPGAPARSLIDDLVAAGFTVPEDKDEPHRGHLYVLGQGDVVEACGQFADAMRQGMAVHLDQVPLTAAVNGARTRRVGDAWVLDRTASLVDVAPLCAVAFARWALLARGPAVLDDYDVLDSVL